MTKPAVSAKVLSHLFTNVNEVMDNAEGSSSSLGTSPLRSDLYSLERCLVMDALRNTADITGYM